MVDKAKAKKTGTKKKDVSAIREEGILTVADIKTMLNIIDICSTRGAFRGTELLAAGIIRERIEAFVAQHEKDFPPPAAAAAEETKSETVDAPKP